MGSLTDEPLSDNAVRVDQATGIREEMGFIEVGAQRLSATAHLPLGPVIGSLVMCQSICVDVIRNYRVEVLAARTLASRGIAVQRFHYRGTGNSDGDTEDMTFPAMVDDAVAVLDDLRRRYPGAPTALLGTRVGAVVAAAAAAGAPGAPLVLFEPITALARFFKEGFRARIAESLAASTKERLTTASLLEQLRQRGSIELLGQTVGMALYESAYDKTVEGCLVEDPRDVLLVQLGQGENLRPDYTRLADSLRERGCRVTDRLVGDEQVWWFIDFDDQQARKLRELRKRTGDVDADELSDCFDQWLQARFDPKESP